jgi:hypothetical protein
MRVAPTLKRPIFWQPGIAVFAASLCYAKITPATLHRGEYRRRCRESAEAAAANPKFGLHDFPRVSAGAAMTTLEAARMAAS